VTSDATNGSNNIATDDDVAKSIAALDQACAKGDSLKAGTLIRVLGSALNIPPCGSDTQLVDAFMAIIRAVAKFQEVRDLSALTRTAESLPLKEATDQKTLSDRLKDFGEAYMKSNKPAQAELLLAAALHFRQKSSSVDEHSVALAASIVNAGVKIGNIDIGIEALKTELARAQEVEGNNIEFKNELLAQLLFYLPQIDRAKEAIPLGLELVNLQAEDVANNLNDFFNAMLGLVLAYIGAEKFDDAAREVRTRASNVVPRLNAVDRDRLLRLPVAIAHTLEHKQQLHEAEKFLLALIDQCRSKLEHPVVIQMAALHTLADLYARHASEEDACPLREELKKLEAEVTKISRSYPQNGSRLLQEGVQLRDQRLYKGAVESLEGAVRIFTETEGEASWNTVSSLTLLGSTQFRDGNTEVARKTLAKCAELIEACPTEKMPQLRLNLMRAFSEIRDYIQVEALAHKILLGINETSESAIETKLVVTNQLADALHAQGRFDEALEFRKSAVETVETIPSESRQALGYMLGNLALTLDALGEGEQAAASYDRSFELIYGIKLGS